MNKRIERLAHRIAKEQISDEEIFIKHMKEKNKSKKEIDNALKLYKALMSDINIDDNEIIKNIVFKNEYKFEDVTIAIVTIKRRLIESTDFDNNYNMIQRMKTKYDTEIIIADDFNCISNIMLKRHINKSQAIKYANKLDTLIRENSLDNILDLVEKNI